MIKSLNKYAFVFALILGCCLLCSGETQAVSTVGAKSNCDIVAISNNYEESCVSCATVNTIISTFMEVGTIAYPLMREAGNTLLMILSALWISIFLLKNLSQFNAIELPDFVQQLGTFLFKVIVAFVCLNGGINAILHYTLEPIISFGSDFAVNILNLASLQLISLDGAFVLQNYTEVCYA